MATRKTARAAAAGTPKPAAKKTRSSKKVSAPAPAPVAEPVKTAPKKLPAPVLVKKTKPA